MTNWIRDDHLNDVDDSKPGLPDNSVDPQLEEWLNGPERDEGNEEEELELDLDPNEPNLEYVPVEKSDPPPFADPKTEPSTEAPGAKGHGASGSGYADRATRSSSLYPSITAVQPAQNETKKPESSSLYSRLAARSNPNGATMTSREYPMPLQHQVLKSNTQSYVQAPSYGVHYARPLSSTDTDTSRLDPMLPQQLVARQASHQSWRFQQRPVSAEPSTFHQQQLGRHQPQRFHQHGSLVEDRRQSGYEAQTAIPGYEQRQLYPQDNGLVGFQGLGSPGFDTRYSQPYDIDNGSYDPHIWEDGELENRNQLFAPQTTTAFSGRHGQYRDPKHMILTNGEPEQAMVHHRHRMSDSQQTPTEMMGLPHRGAPNAEDHVFFESMIDAKVWRQKHLVRTGKVDDSIPRSPEEQKHVVKRLFDAINDVSDPMPSTYVRYFEEHKYSAQFIESVCWVVLEACILRHTHGPLQAEEERAPFKARIADFNSCGERIDRLVDALRKQKAICKKLMEPWHVHQVVDDPVGRIKRTENNKALNDRKAKQIAAGKAANSDDNGRRSRKGRKQPQERQESEDWDEEIEEDSVESSPKSQELHPAFSSPAAVSSKNQNLETISSKKRKAKMEFSDNNSALQSAASGPISKKTKTTTAHPAKESRNERLQGHSNHRSNRYGVMVDQSETRASGTQHRQPYSNQGQSFRHASPSSYGNPSTGRNREGPYYLDPPNTHGRSGGPYPVIEGYHTPTSAYDSQPSLEGDNTVGHHRNHTQPQPLFQRRRRAATDTTTSSAYSASSNHGMRNLNKSWHQSTHTQDEEKAQPGEVSSDSDFTLVKTKKVQKKKT
ncbi:MAG: hypothetical protein M1830_001119 [Pleopsidium flavum]|nr:MAG: hypothetical protein M1830_001119 [Pleopsidium flavum]